MKENTITFNDLKDEKNLVEFLEKVWKAGLRTGRLCPRHTIEQCVDEMMPNFKDRLSQ